MTLEGKNMNRKKSQEHLKNLVLAALLGSMVYVLTAFIKVPTHEGYIHIGDGIIYLAAAILPMPYAMFAGAIGAGLSDYLGGYAMWVLPTVIIKSLMVLAFSRKKETVINLRNLIGLLPAAVICTGGYYLASALMYGDFAAALSDVPTNLLQSAGSAALFVFLGLSLDRLSFKKRFSLTISSKSKKAV